MKVIGLIPRASLALISACLFLLLSVSTAHAQSGSAIYIDDSNVHTATITYTPPPNPTGSCLPGATANSGGCGSLTVTLDKETVPALTVPFNLSYIGPTNGTAYIGFTGATGGGCQTQTVLSLSVGGTSYNFASGWQLNGTAALSESALQLTTSGTDQAGSAWYATPVTVTNAFTATFTFRFTSQGCGSGPADGIAFVIQNSPTTAGDPPTGGIYALGGQGGCLGYGSGSGSACPNGVGGIPNSVAVQFDTYDNGNFGDIAASPTFSTLGVAPYSSTDEVSVQSCGTNPNTTDHTATTGSGLGTGGAISCTFGAVDLSTGTVSQPFNQSGPTTTNFSNSGGTNEQIIDTTNANGDLTCNVPGGTTTTSCGSITLVTTNNAIPNSDPSGTASWPQYVVGSPWATSVCAATPANGTGNACSLFVNSCYGGSSNTSASQADDFYCPYVTSGTTGSINLQDIFDQPASSKLAVPAGTTVSFLDFSPSAAGEAWKPVPPPGMANSVCTYLNGVTSGSGASESINPPPFSPLGYGCDIIDGLVDVSGDQTTTRGKVPKKGWIMTAFDVPMPLTSVEVTGAGSNGCPVTHSPLNDSTPTGPSDTNFENPAYATNIWNNGQCMLDFVVSPAAVPTYLSSGTNNSFQPAPPATFWWAQGTPPAVLPGNIPAPSYNPNPSCGPAPGIPCAPSSWDLSLGKTLATLFGENDGIFTIYWSATDVVGISEKNVQLNPSGSGISCYNPLDQTISPPCYNTSYFTTIVNVDSTNPTITSTLSTPGSPAGTFLQHEAVNVAYSCNDPYANHAASGLSSCAGTIIPKTNGACPTSAPAVTLPLPTGTVGMNQSVTEQTMDCAGNMGSTTITYNVVPSVNLQIKTLPLLTLSVGVPGLIPVTYGAAITNVTAGTTADDVAVTTTFSVPSGILLGTPTASISTVTCSNTPCTLKGITISSNPCSVSGSGSASIVTCSVASLGPVSSKTGLWMEIIAPIVKGSKTGQFTSTSTVSSAGVPLGSVSQTYNVVF